WRRTQYFSCPVCESHTPIFPSTFPAATHLPVGSISTQVHCVRVSLTNRVSFPVAASHTLTFPALVTAAMSFPLRLTATPWTIPGGALEGRSFLPPPRPWAQLHRGVLWSDLKRNLRRGLGG